MNDDKNAFFNADEQEPERSAAGSSRLKTAVLFIAAAILVFFFVNSQLSARSAGYTGFLLGSSCCSSQGAAEPRSASVGSCCSNGVSDSANLESLRQAGLAFYRQNYGDEPVEAVVEDYGCHQEIHIYRDGQLVNRFLNLNGTISEY